MTKRLPGEDLKRRQEPMKEVVRELQARNFDLGSVDALEMFAREGDWQTVVYAPLVRSLTAWEVNPNFHKALKQNLPGASIKITDSWEEIKKTTRKYGMIVVDVPNGIYGDDHCEHFGILPDVFKSIDNGIVIINVNVRPYNLHEDGHWYNRRKKHYNTDRPELLSYGLVARTYERICAKSKIEIKWSFFQPWGHDDFMCYFVMRVSKEKS